MRTWPVALGQLGSEVHSGADTQLSAGIGSRHIKSNSDVTCGADEASQAVWGTGRQWGKDWLSEPAQLVLLHELGCCTRGWHKWMFECACSPLGDTSLSIFCGPLFCFCSASPSLSLSPPLSLPLFFLCLFLCTYKIFAIESEELLLLFTRGQTLLDFPRRQAGGAYSKNKNNKKHNDRSGIIFILL